MLLIHLLICSHLFTHKTKRATYHLIMRTLQLSPSRQSAAAANNNNNSATKRQKRRSVVVVRLSARAENDDVGMMMSTLPLIDIQFEGFNSPDIPASPGIYAIYNDKKELQYVGLSRKISASIKMHCFELPAECGFAKVLPIEEATKVDLQDGWKRWSHDALRSRARGSSKRWAIHHS